MKLIAWLRKDWHFTEDAHRVLLFMSTQVNIVGASAVAFMMYAGWPNWSILAALIVWVALAAFGATIQQPELEK